jgi:hypothetical protein
MAANDEEDLHSPFELGNSKNKELLSFCYYTINFIA